MRHIVIPEKKFSLPTEQKFTLRNPDKESHITTVTDIIVTKCKYCGSKNFVKYGFKNEVQQYLCNDCGRKFNEKDILEGMRTPIPEIATALGLFFDGMSLSNISEQLHHIYSDDVNPSTVYRWVIEYSQKAIYIFKIFTPKVGRVWIVDETVIDIAGNNVWFWDIIDYDTRFLLASHLSTSRTIEHVKAVMEEAKERVNSLCVDALILSDRLRAYDKGIKDVFGKCALHIKSEGFSSDINTNLIERFHGTLKERTKTLRGFKSWETAEIILDGFLINYNFFRPHMTLNNTTPANEAKIKLPFSTWEGLLRYLSRPWIE